MGARKSRWAAKEPMGVRKSRAASPRNLARGGGCRDHGALALADSSYQLGRLGIAAEAGHDVRAVHERLGLLEQRLGHVEANLGATVPRSVKRGSRPVRDRDSGHPVLQELGM